MSKEIEIKAKLENPEEIRQKLADLGARLIEKNRETNISFDFPDKKLIKEDKLLRLRKYGERITMTYKGPKEESSVKTREEIEIEVDDLEKAKSILFSLGFVIRLIFEKNREIYHLDDFEIVIDELPKLGWFCEIEGKSESDVEDMGKRLGIKNITNKTYGYHIKKYGEQTGQEIKRLEF